MDAPVVPAADEFRFRAEVRTRWSDEDNQNVLNNAVVLTLLEESRFAYFTQLGLMEGTHFPFVLAQTNVRFLSPGAGGRVVAVDVCTTHLGRKSFTQVYRVQDARTGRVWAEAEALLVGWDDAERRSRPMTPSFRARLAEFEGLDPA